MFFDFYHLFYYLVLVITAVCSIYYIPKVSKPFKWVGILILVTLLSEFIAKYSAYQSIISQNLIYHIFTPVEYFIYVQIFSNFRASKKWKIGLQVSVVFVIIAEILNTIYLQPIRHTNTNIMIVESTILVCISLLLFLKIKNSMAYDNPLKEGIFWLNSAVLMYYSFNILVWGFHSFKVYNLSNPPMIIYSINLIFSGLLYIVYVFSMFLDRQSIKLTQE